MRVLTQNSIYVECSGYTDHLYSSQKDTILEYEASNFVRTCKFLKLQLNKQNVMSIFFMKCFFLKKRNWSKGHQIQLF
jgi:uncharacterized protein YxeA